MSEAFPLSQPQEYLFRLTAAADAPAYRSLAVVSIEGDLDAELLRTAGSDLVDRYEVLRTVYEQPRGLEAPVQRVQEAGDLPLSWSQVDLSDAEEADQAAGLAALLDEGRGEGEGLRLALARLGPTHHRLVVSVAALAADGLGIGHLTAALERAYQARLEGSSLDEEPMQAADLSAWQRDLMEAEGAEVGVDYWRRQDFSGLLHFRLPFERRADLPFRPQSLERPLEAASRAGIEALVAAVAPAAAAGESELDITADDVLLSAWAVLLARLADQEKLVIGIAGSGRDYEGLEEVVASMSRSLPMLLEVGGGERFTDFLHRVAEAREEAEEWQEYFTWDLWRGSLKGLQGALFFPVLFGAKRAPSMCDLGDSGWCMERWESLEDRFRVRLSSRETSDGGLILALDYDTELLEEGAAELLLERFEALLAAAVATPETALGALDLLGQSERRLLFSEPTAIEEVGEDLTTGEVLARFRRWAEEEPDRPAVWDAEERLTYGALAATVDRVAAGLRRLGVGSEVRVGLAAGRSWKTFAAILGVVEAGATFVPLDPTYPVDRLQFMLEDAGVRVLVAEHGTLEPSVEHGAEVVWLDDLLAEETDGSESEALEASAELASALAYVIYTSGSTGVPRGAMITRGNLATYLDALGSRLGIESSDRYLHTASISFSSSVRQLFLPLAHGAEVVIASEEERRDPLALFARTAECEVTVLDLVPSHWRACIYALEGAEEARRQELLGSNPRLIVTASEPLGSDLPQAWHHRLGHGARMVNMFGQTETTGIVASHGVVPPDPGATVAGVPVGRALDGTRLWVLDRGLRPVPLGVPGRVFVTGVGVGRGYLGRPAMSAARLLPDPCSGRSGGQLYDTGDVGKRRLDGVVELLGRADYQVKIRGLRVELGEIEAALLTHPSVREAVVVPFTGSGSTPRLSAYVVPVEAPGPSGDGLRTYLAERLPEYMVPAFYVTLEELPLAATGKIDRRALPVPSGVGSAAADYVAPRNEIEEQMVDIWNSLLEIERVGIHDNFFRLGGHSLLGTVLMTRLREAFAVDLPVVRLFEAPTVAGLAAILAPLVEGGVEEEAIQRVERESLEVDDLSEDQVNALLSEMMAGEDG